MINFDERTGNPYFIGVDFERDIRYPNFSGTIDEYNQQCDMNPRREPIGRRSFKLVIHDPADAQYFIDNGWNVKQSDRGPDEPPEWTLQIFLVYKNPRFAPVVETVDGDGNVSVKDENSVDDLDNLRIETVDFMIHPYDWEYAGKSGRKAELVKLNAHLYDFPF